LVVPYLTWLNLRPHESASRWARRLKRWRANISGLHSNVTRERGASRYRRTVYHTDVGYKNPRGRIGIWSLRTEKHASTMSSSNHAPTRKAEISITPTCRLRLFKSPGIYRYRSRTERLLFESYLRNPIGAGSVLT
jgi:hypothetical protein